MFRKSEQNTQLQQKNEKIEKPKQRAVANKEQYAAISTQKTVGNLAKRAEGLQLDLQVKAESLNAYDIC